MAAISQGEVERFGDLLLADDVVWHWPGRSPVSGEHRRRDAVVKLLGGEMTGNRLHVEPLDLLEGGTT